MWGEVPHGRGLCDLHSDTDRSYWPLREVKELGVTDTVTLAGATDPWGRWRSLGWQTQWHWQKLLTPERGEGAWGDWHSDTDRSYWPLREVKELGVTQWHWQKLLTLREVKEPGVTDTVTLTEATDRPEGGEGAWGDWHSDTDRSYWLAWGRWRSLGWLTQWH